MRSLRRPFGRRKPWRGCREEGECFSGRCFEESGCSGPCLTSKDLEYVLAIPHKALKAEHEVIFTQLRSIHRLNY